MARTVLIEQPRLQRRRRVQHDWPWMVAFVIPAFLVVVVVQLYPLAYSAFLAVQEWSLTSSQTPEGFNGVQNFVKMFGSDVFRRSVRNSFYITGGAIVIEMLLGMVLAYLTIGSGWLMLIVFNELPKEVEEAAIVDGASPWQRFWHVVLPMTAPGVASAAILTAFLSWNEFLIAASVARRKAMVLSIAVASFVTDKGILWGQMSAMSVVMIVPMLLFALFVQRYLIRGITLGAVKG